MKIICTSCNNEIFEFRRRRGTVPDASDFRPLDGGDPPSGEGAMLCPKCGRKFYSQSLDGSICLFLGNDQWWPSPPLDLCC